MLIHLLHTCKYPFFKYFICCTLATPHFFHIFYLLHTCNYAFVFFFKFVTNWQLRIFFILGSTRKQLLLMYEFTFPIYSLNDLFIRKKLRVVMKSKFMYWLVIFVVVCNSVSAAVQHYRQPQWITDVIGS